MAADFSKISIGIDIDDTIFTCVSTMLDYINERIGTNLKIEDMKTYWLEDYVPEPFKWIVENGFHDKAFWKAIQPIVKAGESIVRLREMGFNVYFVTASLPENLRKKINYLGRYLTSIEKEIFQTGWKYKDEKKPFVWNEEYMRNHTINIRNKKLLKLDFLIDDNISNLRGGDYYGICLKYPWNAPHILLRRVSFVEDWTEAMITIAAILKKDYGYAPCDVLGMEEIESVGGVREFDMTPKD